MPKTLTLIEDDPVIRESIVEYISLNTDFKIITEHESVEDFMKNSFQSEIPKILLLDIGLPGISGLEGIIPIKKRFPHLDIIMLTTFEESEMIFEALSSGACSYISKRSSLVKIAEAVKIVADGGSYMSPSIARKIAEKFFNQPKQAKSSLTDRQKEIINYIADGLKYREIADKCFISMNTVRSHIKNIYEELQINSKAELIKKYYDGEI